METKILILRLPLFELKKIEIIQTYFFSNVEYNDQLKTQTSIHTSPILKVKETIFWMSAFEIIVPTPNIDKINPDIWNIFVFSIFIIKEKIIIIGGMAASIKTAFMTCVKFKAK